MFCSDHTRLCIVQAINPIKSRTNSEAHHATSISPIQLAAAFTRRSSACLPSWRQETEPEPSQYQHNCQDFVQTETDAG